jgi:hypothetical protein
MYADSVREHGQRAPFAIGTTSPEAVAAAVVRAIERDAPEIIVSSRPIRFLLVLGAISPRLGEWLLRKLGGHQIFEAAARVTGRAGRSGSDSSP